MSHVVDKSKTRRQAMMTDADRRNRLAHAALSRRQLLQTAGLGLAAVTLPGWRVAAAGAATPIAGTPAATGTIDRAAVTAALPQLVELAKATVASGAVPGLALAVVFRDEVLLTAGYGVRSTASREPVDADTLFQLASLAKPVGSTVVSAIVGGGAATWDDPVTLHLPDFRLSDPWATQELMIGDFYAHRSGLGGDAGGDLERIGYDRDAIVERLRFLDLASSPRTTYAYSNMGMTVGGLAAAAAIGMTWEDASAKLLYEPLGMTRTSSRYADFQAASNRAALHVRLGDAWEPKFTFNPNAQAPAGGVSSTANDMARWLRLLLGDGTVDGRALIPAAALQEARKPRMSLGPSPVTGGPNFYGYGWIIEDRRDGRQALLHAGAFSVGARTMAMLLPEERLGIAILSNAFPTGVPDGLAASLFDFVLQGRLSRDWIAAWNAIYDMLLASMAAGGAPYVTAPAAPTPALPAGAYVGTYANDYAGPVEVSGGDGALSLRLGPDRRAFALTHFNHDVFTFLVDPEPPAPLTGATFVVGSDGTAAALLLDYFAGNGQALFQRQPAD
jgi:CubicO group peptidase (beta-lactamase class C family)